MSRKSQTRLNRDAQKGLYLHRVTDIQKGDVITANTPGAIERLIAQVRADERALIMEELIPKLTEITRYLMLRQRLGDAIGQVMAMAMPGPPKDNIKEILLSQPADVTLSALFTETIGLHKRLGLPAELLPDGAAVAACINAIQAAQNGDGGKALVEVAVDYGNLTAADIAKYVLPTFAKMGRAKGKDPARLLIGEQLIAIQHETDHQWIYCADQLKRDLSNKPDKSRIEQDALELLQTADTGYLRGVVRDYREAEKRAGNITRTH